MSYNQITVVINTFNSEDKIHQCLNSIPTEVKIIIIENSNNILFKNDIENKYVNVKCFLAGQNLGYAKGNNLGLSKVNTDYALILNPDAIIEKNTLENLLSLVKKFPISKNNEQGILNLYFLYDFPVFERLPVKINDHITYSYWDDDNKNAIITKKNRNL